MDINYWLYKKNILPQHTDHAGVMWHGAYLNMLEESRIDALNKAGIKYIDLLNEGLEMPIYKIEIKYLIPIKIGQEIIIKSSFIINEGPRIKIHSKFLCKREICHTEANLDLVLINRETFKVLRKRPKFMDLYFNNLNKVVTY